MAGVGTAAREEKGKVEDLGRVEVQEVGDRHSPAGSAGQYVRTTASRCR